jgi:hypothetical protein
LVEHINATNMKEPPLAAKKLDDRQADRVRTAWRSRREDTVRSIVKRRHPDQLESLSTIEYPEDEQVRKAFDVSETDLEFGEDLEDAVHIVLCAPTVDLKFTTLPMSAGVVICVDVPGAIEQTNGCECCAGRYGHPAGG